MSSSSFAAHHAILKLIQPGDQLALVVDQLDQAVVPRDQGPGRAPHPKCALAVVLHTLAPEERSEAGSSEQAALILVRRPETTPLILSCVAITSDLRTTIAQTADSEAADAKPRFRVEFSHAPDEAPRAEDDSGQANHGLIDGDISMAILVDDMERMTTLLGVVRQRIESAKPAAEPDNDAVSSDHAADASGTDPASIKRSSFAWLEAYATASATSRQDAQDDESRRRRFDGISSTYAMRDSQSTGLRGGLSSSHWNGAGDYGVDEVELEMLREREAAQQRERWIVERMQAREGEFTTCENIKVFCGTYNVNDAMPKDATHLSSWVEDAKDAELLVFGFQEFDLSTEAMLRYTTYREDAWRAAIERALGDRAGQYEKLHSRQLVGVLILIYVRKESARYIRSVTSAHLATGTMGFFNKGAVGVRFKFKDTWLVFVNSHLAAFTNQLAQRNEMVRNTARSLIFPPPRGPVTPRDPFTPNLRPSEVGLDRPSSTTPAGETIYDAHHLIWLGDLNYRLDLARDDVLRLIESKEWDLLHRFDQLRIQRKERLAFADFEEAEIDFPPTFKFDPASTKYDTSEKQRTPSWTDRISWLSLRPGMIKAQSYRGHFDVMLSDHRPVSAVLQVPIATVLPEKRLQVQREVIEELDTFDNDSLPDVKIAPSPSVEFDVIKYDQAETRSIELRNVGSVVAQWTLVLKPGTATLTPPWLTVSPTCGLILPGGLTRLDFTVHVDASTASGFNFSAKDSEPLSDLLVLSLGSKDLFLSVSTRDYERTCFANSLERLHELGDDPIRKASLKKLALIEAGTYLMPEAQQTATSHSPDDTQTSRGTDEDVVDTDSDAQKREAKATSAVVIRPLQRMLDWLVEYGFQEPDLFCAPASAVDEGLVRSIRDALDTGEPLPNVDLLGGPQRSATTSDSSTSGQTGLGSDAHAAETLLKRLDAQHAEAEAVADGADLGGMTLSDHQPLPTLQQATEIKRSMTKDDEMENDSERLRGRRRGVASMAACLLRWLDSLPEPVVPFELYTKALRAETSRDEAYTVVASLPKLHADTLLYLVAFLRAVAAQHVTRPEEAVARLSRLAVVFSPLLLRGGPQAIPDPSITPSSIPRRKKQFMLHLLEEEKPKADESAASAQLE